ncbi:MAG: hypothetical protein ACKO4S_12255 [Snowella sp.]
MLDKIIGLIPEFYFDLIARICPGSLICIALAFPIVQLEALVLKIKEIPVPLIFLFLVASYITGFLLDAVTAFVEEYFDSIYYALRKYIYYPLSDALRSDALRNNSKNYTLRKNTKISEYRTIYEDIGGIAEYANPSSIISLKKVAAELTLLRVLIAGWIIIYVLNKYSLQEHPLIFLIVLISLVVSYIKWFSCIKKSIAHLSRAKPKI